MRIVFPRPRRCHLIFWGFRGSRPRAGRGRGVYPGAVPVTFDVSRVRASYPALRDGHAYLDGAAGTQVPEAVIDAIAAAYRAGIGNVGGAFAASDRSGAIAADCRAAIADLVGGTAAGVVLGPSMTALTYRISTALAKGWGPGDEIVVSRLDHDANIRPWVQAAERVGATVRWADADMATGELPAGQYADLVTSRTKLVAVTAASNVLGTRPDIPAIAAAAHAEGALCYVDGVHATPHLPVDVASLGADFYATSAYKWAGPHVAAVIAAPALLETLRPDKLVPAPNQVPQRFERGTLPYADLAGVTAAVEHLAGLGGEAGAEAGADGPGASRRERILASMAAVEAYEMSLLARLLDGLGGMSHVTLYGKAARRAPTSYFTVAGMTPAEVAAHCAARGVNVWNGDNYAYELCQGLGLAPDGAVRVGLVHYNDESDVDRLLTAVGELTAR
jgi:cysteine desulfurase family protein (TIGR01976 family)